MADSALWLVRSPVNQTPSEGSTITIIKYYYLTLTLKYKVLWKWRDIRPCMVTHTQNLCSAINPSKVHTHSSEHTHCEHTPGAVGSHLCCSTRGAVAVWCLAQGHLSRGIEVERALYIHSPHLQSLPDLRLELTTFGLRVRLSNH